MAKIQKGDFGYINSQKKKRVAITILMFAIPVIIFLTGLHITHTRKNMFTLVAILGCLPASKFAVNMIMIWLQKPITQAQHDEIAAHVRDMTVIYETTVSAYEKNTPFVCMVVSGLNVIGFTQSPKADPAFAEQSPRRCASAQTAAVFRRMLPWCRSNSPCRRDSTGCASCPL